jgi:arginine decarboxylase
MKQNKTALFIVLFLISLVSLGCGRPKEAERKEAAPFFQHLVDYISQDKEPWCTPGHQAGVGFLKSDIGTQFFETFGKNIFKGDVSSGMTQLGLVLEHTGSVGDAERNASRIFGSDYTLFVVNGTSTSNKIVFNSCVSPGDIVLADRNCHKSTMHAMIMTDSIPIYLRSTRNDYGLIGPVSMGEFTHESIEQKIEESPLIKEKTKEISLSVLTNSTYDGIIYNIAEIKKLLSPEVKNILFDEAWYAYAKFHPLYKSRFAMSLVGNPKNHPPIYSTQSTHKMLTAFSQASMIHIKDGTINKIDPEVFNEAWLMHSSTSPFYPIVASLDVAAASMDGESGKRIMDDVMRQAIRFRKIMAKKYKESTNGKSNNGWWFKPWQPEDIANTSTDKLLSDSKYWILKQDDKWHGFDNIGTGEAMLDPIKISILMPGVSLDGSTSNEGIPAPILEKYLYKHGIIPERVGFYNMLFLFSAGVTKEKSDNLLAKLEGFKMLYDQNASMSVIFNSGELPKKYSTMGLRDFANKMHRYLIDEKIITISKDMYTHLPRQAMIPSKAFAQAVRKNIEYVNVADLMGRVSTVMIAPYPPGIPVIMPGEQFTPESKAILDYFVVAEKFDNEYPGFQLDIHGMIVKKDNGKKIYQIMCVKE